MFDHKSRVQYLSRKGNRDPIHLPNTPTIIGSWGVKQTSWRMLRRGGSWKDTPIKMASEWSTLTISSQLNSIFILGLLGGSSSPLPPSKLWVIATLLQFDWAYFYQKCSQIQPQSKNMQFFLSQIQNSVPMTVVIILFGQLRIVDFSMITPYIPDFPPKEKS